MDIRLNDKKYELTELSDGGTRLFGCTFSGVPDGKFAKEVSEMLQEEESLAADLSYLL